jgi:hypothetical protein
VAAGRTARRPLEHGLDPVGAAEDALDLCAPSAACDDGELTALRTTQSLAFEDDRCPGREIRLADDELSSARDLDDGADGFHVCQKRAWRSGHPGPPPTASLARKL